MRNAQNKILSPVPAGKYGKLTKCSIWRRHRAKDGKSGLEPDRVRALGTLHSYRYNKKLVAGKQWESHLVSNDEKEKWIEDYVDRETAVARQRVEDAETAIKVEQEDVRIT